MDWFSIQTRFIDKPWSQYKYDLLAALKLSNLNKACFPGLVEQMIESDPKCMFNKQRLQKALEEGKVEEPYISILFDKHKSLLDCVAFYEKLLKYKSENEYVNISVKDFHDTVSKTYFGTIENRKALKDILTKPKYCTLLLHPDEFLKDVQDDYWDSGMDDNLPPYVAMTILNDRKYYAKDDVQELL